MNDMVPGFLEDKSKYQLAKRYWQSLWYSLAVPQGWIPDCFDDDGDGNPIFGAICPFLKKGVRIIQLDPSEGHDFISYNDWLGEQDTQDGIEELVIACILTRTNLERAENEILSWVRPFVGTRRVVQFQARATDFQSAYKPITSGRRYQSPTVMDNRMATQPSY